MNIEHLRVFHVAADKKSFSKAAKVLHLSQPTVSLQIQYLEEEMGARLFERTTKSIKLTNEGRLLLTYAEQILHLVDKSKKEIAILSNSISGDLHIGASLTIGQYVLPYILEGFRTQYPNVNLLIKTRNSHDIIRQLTENEIQIGLIEADIKHPSLHFQPFLEDELIIIVSKKNSYPILENKETIAPEELFSLPFIVHEQGSGTRQAMEESLRKNNVSPSNLNIILEGGNTESIKTMVEMGMGVSIISRSAIQKELQLNTLRAIKIRGITLRRSFYLVLLKSKVSSLTTESFIKYALEQNTRSI